MRHHVKAFAIGLFVLSGAAAAQVSVDSSWTYQGRLTSSGSPATGAHDLRFTLYADAAGTQQVGSPVVRSNVSVSDGLFTVSLDFGAQFTGLKRWMKTEVKPAGSPTYTALSPLQEVTSVPQSLFAARPWETTGSGIQYNGSVGVGGAASSQYGVMVHNPWYGLAHTDGTRVLSTFLNSSGGWLGTVSNNPLHFFTNDSGALVTIDTVGSMGIGTTTPAATLHLRKPTSITQLIETTGGTNSWTRTMYKTTNGSWEIGTSQAFNGDQFYIYRSGASTIALAVNPNGITDVRTLRINGGSDVAEPFNVRGTPSGDGGEVLPGMVVVIDEANPGELRMSHEAYDAKVAGIISGANGLAPGMVLQAEGQTGGDHPVAMTGRVWCYVDASFGSIRPGDRLTTSPTPGHAMLASDSARCDGTVIGKAMTSLESGRGMVLVWVNLQ